MRAGGDSMTRHLLLLFLLAAATALPDADLAPDFRSDSSALRAQLRSDVMNRPNYDKIVPPTSNRSAAGSDYSNAGTDVSLEIKFFKVQAVSPAEGSMKLKVWLRMAWTDTRLAWDPIDYGNITTTYYQGEGYSGHETSEVWVPDIQPYNSDQGIVTSLDPSPVRVNYKGEAFMSRPGSIDVACRFSGLVAFPFDQLSCPIEFGGWSFSGGHQGLFLKNKGYIFDNSQELSLGTSYQQYKIDNVNVSINLYTYPDYPSEPWPIAMYTVTLFRASFFYIPLVIVPGIIITLLSFTVFWTDTESADALGFGITIIVVNILSNVVLIELLPVCGELIWVDMFTIVNTSFCCLSLFQSAFNIMLENKTDESLLPLWVKRAWYALRKTQLCRKLSTSQVVRNLTKFGSNIGGFNTSEEDEAIVKMAENKHHTAADAMKLLKFSATLNESVAGVLYRQAAGRVPTPRPRKSSVRPDFGVGGGRGASFGHEAMAQATAIERARKLTFFEHLFFTLDVDSSLFIDADECSALLSYTLLDLDPAQRQGIMGQYDSQTKDGKLSRVEFCCMCADLLWDVPEDQLERAVKNAKSVKTGLSRRNSRYWKEMAGIVDGWSRIIVPGLYVFSQLIVFNLELGDKYDLKESQDSGAKPFQGVNSVRFGDSGPAIVALYIVTCIVCFGGYWWFKRLAILDQKHEQAVLRDAARRVTKRASESASLSATRSAISMGVIPTAGNLPKPAAREKSKERRNSLVITVSAKDVEVQQPPTSGDQDSQSKA